MNSRNWYENSTRRVCYQDRRRRRKGLLPSEERRLALAPPERGWQTLKREEKRTGEIQVASQQGKGNVDGGFASVGKNMLAHGMSSKRGSQQVG